MEAIIQNIRDWFLSKKEHFEVFAEADTRLEGWFKGELIVLFNSLLQRGVIEKFEREPKIDTPAGRKQIDFIISLNGESHLCELKALCISQAAGTPRNLHFYFREDNVGVIKDFRKLESLSGKNKWVIGFIYPNPKYEHWVKEISSLSDDLKHWKCITDPSNFPNFLFISIWRS
jgi:hypothetical protein